MDPIKVFVGTDVNGGCAECQMVFEYSLRKHSSRPIELTWMKISEDKTSFWSGWDTRLWSTPFSGFRWGIPEYCEFRGRAIYCDDDQLWLSDPAELWDVEMHPDAICQAKFHKPTGELRYCVVLWDNEKAKEVLLPIERNKRLPEFHSRMINLVSSGGRVEPFANPNWNNFDGENTPIEDIKLLHLTDMSSNPGVHMAVRRLGDQAKHWYNGPLRAHRRNDIVELFNQYYEEALVEGYKLEDYLPETRLEYTKQDQSGYRSNNGYDVTKGE